ncbi:MAG: phosphomethylpyrimidine synthase ThiC [Oscillospiraceae bacterium]|nr:phosphomethylpyrimidine synthase ThiC [Oscillospiraceae bacterium]
MPNETQPNDTQLNDTQPNKTLSYKTQMEAARRGIVTCEMETAARDERVPAEELMRMVASGHAVIPSNINHKSGRPRAICGTLKTKINVNLGASADCHNTDVEMAKVRKAESLGADAIMDLSTFGDTRAFRRELAAGCGAALGSVPIYDALVYYDKDLADISPDEWLDVVRIHAEDGIDFLTIHAGMNRAAAARFKRARGHGGGNGRGYNGGGGNGYGCSSGSGHSGGNGRGRITNIVSRGGSLMYAWMEMTGRENPFYERFDDLLDICRAYDVTLSLGDACRPGCVSDASDAAQTDEMITLGELALRAWDKDVQVIIEGPGHMPIDQIAANVQLQKTLCHGAPYYVLGPLVTDVAPGYDHITSAIGGAIAAASGAAFLCYVTPAEHLRLPDEQDVHDGIIAAKIAAHAGDLAKKVPGAYEWDDNISRARQEVNWEAMFAHAIDPAKAKKVHDEAPSKIAGACTMCGHMCAMRNMNKILNGEQVTAR